MSKYLNRLNAGMFLCEKYEEKNGTLLNIHNIKDTLELDEHQKVTFSYICILDFVEFEIPPGEDILSFRFYIRSLGGDGRYILPFLVSEMNLAHDTHVITQSLPLMLLINDFDFPRPGDYAIEVYKYYGKIEPKIEEQDINYYRMPSNFINAKVFTVK